MAWHPLPSLKDNTSLSLPWNTSLILPGNPPSPHLDNATLAMFQNKMAAYVMSAVYAVVALVNLAGNGLSLWLLLFRTSPKTSSIIFMINLTLTDLALAAALPFQIQYLLQGYHWGLGAATCNSLTVVFYANMYCSVLTMTAIAADRYLGIVRPMCFRGVRGRKGLAVALCGFMWLLVLAVLSPMMLTDLTFPIPELGITTCFDFLKKDMLPSLAHWAAFLFSLIVLLFLVPFCVTVYCYAAVIRTLARDARNSQKRRAVRLALLVLFVFTVCFAPNNALLLAHTIRRLFYKDSLYLAYKLSLSLSCLNSCLDPFIYYLASREFRQKFRHVLRLKSFSSTQNNEILSSSHYGPQSHEGEAAKTFTLLYKDPTPKGSS